MIDEGIGFRLVFGFPLLSDPPFLRNSLFTCIESCATYNGNFFLGLQAGGDT